MPIVERTYKVELAMHARGQGDKAVCGKERLLVTDNNAEVTCKFCLRMLAIEERWKRK